MTRAILTPYRIPMGSMTDIKRVLLRPSEIANPLISTLLATVVAWGARWLIIGDGHSAVAVRAVLLILFRVISALCLVPLDVVSVRLSVLPRDDSRGELARVQLEDGEALLSTRLMPCSRGEAVIRMRTAGYAGLLDCAKTVAREEGKGALFRGWIWTLIGGSFSAMG